MERQLISILPDLKRFAVSLTGNRDDALDLIQDTCLRALKSKNRFDGKNFKAWMFTICKNQFINRYREKQTRNEIVDITPDLYYLNHKAITSHESDYTITELQRFIDRLNDKHKIPFQMLIDGYQYDEIKKQLGIKLGTVKSRIFFARKQLINDIKKSE